MIFRNSHFILIVLLLVSCSKFQRIQKKGSYEEKLEAAMNYYDEEDYHKAGILLEQVTPYLSGKAEAEKAHFYYAYTQYNQKAYTMSGYYFKKFFKTYPRSIYTEEAMFMHAKSLYLLSPKSSLDQQNTYDAINAFHSYLTKFPNADNKQESNDYVDELYQKLEKKDYENTKLYHRTKRYKAAIVAIDNFRNNNPGSKYNEELMFLKFEAQYEYAKKSVEIAKVEGEIVHVQDQRYRKALEFYRNFVDSYPNSEYISKAEHHYDLIIKKLENS